MGDLTSCAKLPSCLKIGGAPKLPVGDHYFPMAVTWGTPIFTKKLWLESLARFTSQQILQGAKAAIEQCEYLPNLHRMMQLCQAQGPGGDLPSAHDAYLEACNAHSPKAAYPWSHPAVYHAAAQTGWYALAGEMEHKLFPLFEKNYLLVCQRVLDGEKLVVEMPELLEEIPAEPLSKQENQERVSALKDLLAER